MEPNSRAYFGDKLRRTGTDALKAKVITVMPYEKFANFQKYIKNIRQRTKLTGSKTKQYMTTDKRRARGGVGEHKRLKPGQGALCERAKKTGEVKSRGPYCRNKWHQYHDRRQSVDLPCTKQRVPPSRRDI